MAGGGRGGRRLRAPLPLPRPSTRVCPILKPGLLLGVGNHHHDPPGCYLPILILLETSPSLPPWPGSHGHLVHPGISLPGGDLAPPVGADHVKVDSLDAKPGFCSRHGSDKPLPLRRLGFPCDTVRAPPTTGWKDEDLRSKKPTTLAGTEQKLPASR